MDAGIKTILVGIGGRLLNYGFSLFTAPRGNPVETRIQHLDRLIQALPVGEITETPTKAPESPAEGLLPATLPQTLPEENPTAQIATACVPCALGHFARSAGALNEAIRFKGEGMTSNEILDRIASVLEEQNALERFDLTPEKLQRTPRWEREIAEEALQQSRKLRHRLEQIQSIDELEQAAADTAGYYKKLNRQWFKGRFGYLGAKKADAIAQKVGEA